MSGKVLSGHTKQVHAEGGEDELGPSAEHIADVEQVLKLAAKKCPSWLRKNARTKSVNSGTERSFLHFREERTDGEGAEKKE